MKVLIDIPEEMLYRFKNNGEQRYYDYHTVLTACINGKPLPKHYGRLVDADALSESIDYFHSHRLSELFEIAIASAETIIEAEREDAHESSN